MVTETSIDSAFAWARCEREISEARGVLDPGPCEQSDHEWRCRLAGVRFSCQTRCRCDSL